jgi:hypothetical protein
VAGLAARATLVSIALAQTPPAAPTARPYVPTVTLAEPNMPRTSFGQPSLEGVWGANFFLPLESTAAAPNLVTSEEGSKAMLKAFVTQINAIPALSLDPEIGPGLEASEGLAIVRGERRTRAVVEPADGKIPYTPVVRGQALSGLLTMGPMDNPEQRPTMERCLTGFAIPPIAQTNGQPMQIIQTPTHVVIHAEYNNDLRIIPFASDHKPAILTTWLGDSIARWEGETLVIETVRTSKQDRVRLFPPMVVPETSKITERLTRLSQGELLYQFTVEDPTAFTKPWLAEYSLYPAKGRAYEFACHEGNYALPNIMKAARVAEERKAAVAAIKKKGNP